MKTFVFDNNYNATGPDYPVSWYFLADSALTNAGKPFFIPDFAEEFEAIPTIAIRINRLGKSIASRFGGRYYSEYAPAIHFRAKDLMSRLAECHLPADRAYSFDRSFIMADFKPMPASEDLVVAMNKNGNTVTEFKTSKLHLPINETIAQASCTNTLKIGDLMVPGLPFGESVAIGDVLELSVDDSPVLTVQIK